MQCYLYCRQPIEVCKCKNWAQEVRHKPRHTLDRTRQGRNVWKAIENKNDTGMWFVVYYNKGVWQGEHWTNTGRMCGLVESKIYWKGKTITSKSTTKAISVEWRRIRSRGPHTSLNEKVLQKLWPFLPWSAFGQWRVQLRIMSEGMVHISLRRWICYTNGGFNVRFRRKKSWDNSKLGRWLVHLSSSYS